MKEEEQMELQMINVLIDDIKSGKPNLCKHPKKMQDKDPNGKLYCMKCGEDL